MNESLKKNNNKTWKWRKSVDDDNQQQLSLSMAITVLALTYYDSIQTNTFFHIQTENDTRFLNKDQTSIQQK